MDGGTIVDTNTQYTQKHFAEVSAEKKCSKTLMAWKNDRAVSELVLSAANGDFTNVTIQTRDLTDGKKKIAKENVTATFISMEMMFRRQQKTTGRKHRIFSGRVHQST